MVSHFEVRRMVVLTRRKLISHLNFDRTASVGPVKPEETPETLWGKDIPAPGEAFVANGFQMKRVVLTRQGRAPANGKE